MSTQFSGGPTRNVQAGDTPDLNDGVLSRLIVNALNLVRGTACYLVNGEITVEEARRARELEYRTGNALGEHWGVDGTHSILLPEIDDKGITVRDPVLIDLEGNVLATTLKEGAPYKR